MFMEKPKTASITFTREDLDKTYHNAFDCPIYRALDNAGVEVHTVFPFRWYDSKLHAHGFSPRLIAISVFLRLTDRVRFVRPWLLAGRSIQVAL